MLRTWIAVLVVAGVAVAAIVDGVRSGGGRSAKPQPVHKIAGDDELVGPEVPPAGGLPGTLVLARRDGCRVQTIAFAGPEASQPGVRTTCGLWASPAGGYAVVSTSRRLSKAAIASISLIRLDDPPVVVRRLGRALGEPSWAPDGKEVAWCTLAGTSLIQNVQTAAVKEYPGCRPRFTPDGHLLLVPAGEIPQELWRDGSVFLDARALASGLPGADPAQIGVLDYDQAPDGTLAVTVMQSGPTGNVAALELWHGTNLLGSFLLPSGSGPRGERIGQLVRLSPDGKELAIGPRTPEGHDPLTFFDLRLRKVSLSVDAQSGFAWSPDGAWLAVADGTDVAFYSQNGGDAVYRLPLAVNGLSWVAGGSATG
jgi:hypothetical protein